VAEAVFVFISIRPMNGTAMNLDNGPFSFIVVGFVNPFSSANKIARNLNNYPLRSLPLASDNRQIANDQMALEDLPLGLVFGAVI
jgi:hypothetical protein